MKAKENFLERLKQAREIFKDDSAVTLVMDMLLFEYETKVLSK